MNLQNVDRRDYPIEEKVDDDFEVRGKVVSHVFNILVCKKGIDKGMVLRVVDMRHFIQFCKSMNFHHGYRVGVEVEKAVHKDYKKGQVFDIFVPGHCDLVEYLTEKYSFL